MGKSKLWDRGEGMEGGGVANERQLWLDWGVTNEWDSPEGVGASKALLGGLSLLTPCTLSALPHLIVTALCIIYAPFIALI